MHARSTLQVSYAYSVIHARLNRVCSKRASPPISTEIGALGSRSGQASINFTAYSYHPRSEGLATSAAVALPPDYGDGLTPSIRLTPWSRSRAKRQANRRRRPEPGIPLGSRFAPLPPFAVLTSAHWSGKDEPVKGVGPTVPEGTTQSATSSRTGRFIFFRKAL